MRKGLLYTGVVVAVLIATLVVGFVFRVELVQARLSPPEQFDAELAPAAPDYALLTNWASHPEIADAADLPLPGAGPVAEPPPVDVFYVHPTTYFGPGPWNELALPDNATGQNTEPVLAVQASVFNECCRVYMPHYRQAHFASFLTKDSTAGFEALEFAYQDVERAFDHFIEHFNNGRPFIVAGHSQGTLHAVRLLETKIQDTPLHDRLVVAYPIGYWVPQDKLENGLGRIGLCESPDQVGCFATFDTYGADGPGRDTSGSLPYWYNSGWEMKKTDKTLCVNPLSWTADSGRVPASEHLGALAVKPVFSLPHQLLNQHAGRVYAELPAPLEQYTFAECAENGILLVETQLDTPFARGAGADQSYHSYDWSIFYVNIRRNAAQRIAAYLAQ